MDSRQKKRKVNRKRRVLKITLLVSTVLLLALGAGFWYIYSQVSNTASNSYEQLERGDKSNLRVEPVDVGKDNFSMLLLGSDYREGDDYERTDTLIVATFNKSDRSIILTSIPRDTYTEIIGYHGGGIYDKINHAHAFGGMSMAVDTVENLLDIPIDHYALIRFDGFVEVIDALGGVEVDVTYEFDFKEASTNADYSFTEGPTQMDGSKALAMRENVNLLKVAETKVEEFANNKLLNLLLMNQLLYQILLILMMCFKQWVITLEWI